MGILEQYEDIKDTNNILEVVTFLNKWDLEDEDFKDENPLFCINGLEFFNFNCTDGEGHVFTVFCCKSNEYSFDFDDLLYKSGFSEYLKEKNINEDDIFLDSDIVGILYNETIVNKYLKEYYS